MDRDWLEQRLRAGRSIASIAAEAGRGQSTVAYWINKHGLLAAGSRRHRAKGPLDEAEVRALVEQGLSVRQMAAELDRSPTAVRHWLRRFGLTTQPSSYHRGSDKPDDVVRECRAHGWTLFGLDTTRRHYRCRACNVERVAERRRRTKGILVSEAGGRCVLCGYDRYPGALQFHHLDKDRKRFEIGGRGLTRRIADLREEAKACALLCGNCHAEVEAGFSRLPLSLAVGDASRRQSMGGSSMAEQSTVNR